jgi:lipopolysaccharide/colanic/teichoic acid biosynthesis glycosyltransferase
MRARADQRQVAEEHHVEQLRQFVEAGLADEAADAGHPRVALQAKAENRLYDEAVDGYFARHRVKPGLTGWAQIHGWRGETDSQEKIQQRVEHDLYYIENWSIPLDLYIVAHTPFALLRTENAY